MSFNNRVFQEINWSELEFDNIGQWPSIIKIICCVFMACVVIFLSFHLFVSDEIARYDNTVKKQTQLLSIYRDKYAVASKLTIYRQQMREMEKTFAQLLKHLPTSNETPGLLDDLSYAGTTSGLTFLKIGWLPEIEKKLYTELPIKIEVQGSYHQFGEFAEKVAKLPRIVSLHDFSILSTNQETLTFNVVAKTYRYKKSNKDET